MQTSTQNNQTKPPVWAIVLGAIRNREEFDPLYTWLTDACTRGVLDGVVFVSWTGQYSSDKQLIDRIVANGHRLIELEEPFIKIPHYGHIFHQMKALYYGLHCCPADAFVLKVRTDKYGSVEDLEPLLETRALPPCDLSVGWPAIFDSRIYVRCAAVLNPFFINDIVYYGKRTDLQKLVNFDLRYLEVFKRMIPEQWFFSNPFIKHFPLFEDYYCVQPRLGVGGLPGTFRFIDLIQKEPFLMHVITTYHEILSRYFIIGDVHRACGQRQEVEESTVKDFSSLFHDSIPAEAIFKHPAGGWPFASAHRWLDLIDRRDFYPSPFWDKYFESKLTTINMQFHNNYNPCPLLHGEMLRMHTLIENDVCNFPDTVDAKPN